MNISIHIDILSIFIFTGVFLGFLLSFFFILKPSRNSKANLFQGLLLLSLSYIIFEQVLNLTGYIVKVLPLTFTSASMNFLIGPFLYLYVKRSINQTGSAKEWLHFIIPILYLGYLSFNLIQPDEFKYNIYVLNHHPEWPLLDVTSTVSNDPLKINKYLTPAQAVQILFYILLAFGKLLLKTGKTGSSVFRTDDEVIKSLRFVIFHSFILFLVFTMVKITFHGNAGDYFIGIYVAVFTFFTTLRVMNDSAYFDRSASFLDFPIRKYHKSSLDEKGKQNILEKIIQEFETREYFSESLASLSDLAKKIGESPHHVSQVMNEKLEKSFFELLASYRVAKAKEIINNDKKNTLTIEEISEMVGYNSRTAFNNAFRRHSGKTPSEFRKSTDRR